MDKSIFMARNRKPDDKALREALGNTYDLWESIRDYVLEIYPDAREEWSYPGEKYGWGFRMKDKKRAIIYLLPRDAFFKVAFVFGEKATGIIMNSDIREPVKTELANAKVYAEGRGIRIDINDTTILRDIKQLIEIKVRS